MKRARAKNGGGAPSTPPAKRAGDVLAIPISAKEAALYKKGQVFVTRQQKLLADAEKNFPDGLLTSHLDWLFVNLLLRRDTENCNTGVPDLRHEIEVQGFRPPAPATLRKLFDRFAEAGYIYFRQKAGRVELYEPTKKLHQTMGNLAGGRLAGTLASAPKD